MSKNTCTACQTEYGKPEDHCHKQNGRKCYLKVQEEEVLNLYNSKDWGNFAEDSTDGDND